MEAPELGPEILLAKPGEPAELAPGPLLRSPPLAFHLVAARNGNIQLHGDPSTPDPRPILVATLPYPVDEQGALDPLPGIYEGLDWISDDPGISLHVSVAGNFAGPQDGWLIMFTNDGPAYQGLPIAYEWTAPGWRLLRKRRGSFTQIPFDLDVRGDALFAHVDYLRLSQSDAVVIRWNDDSERGAPASERVRLRGNAPAPEYHAELRGLSMPGTSSLGDLYAAAFVADPNGHYSAQLLHWPAEETRATTFPLPEVVSPASDDGMYGAQLRVTATDAEVAVSGSLHVEGYQAQITYLAVGQPGTLRRIPLEFEGRACVGAPTSVALGPDGDYWLVIEGGLYSVDSSGKLQRYELPDLRTIDPPLDLRDWAWDAGWRLAGDSTSELIGDRPAELQEVQRIGPDLWLRMEVPVPYFGETIVAVFKTGPHVDPVILPSFDQVIGETQRRNDSWMILRLRDGIDEAGVDAFVDELLPDLRGRPEVLQVYEVQSQTGLAIDAVIVPEEWQGELVHEYADLLGHAATRLQPGDVDPGAIRESLYSKWGD